MTRCRLCNNAKMIAGLGMIRRACSCTQTTRSTLVREEAKKVVAQTSEVVDTSSYEESKEKKERKRRGATKKKRSWIDK